MPILTLPIRCLATNDLICGVPVSASPDSNSREIDISVLRSAVQRARQTEDDIEDPPFGYTLWLRLKVSPDADSGTGGIDDGAALASKKQKVSETVEDRSRVRLLPGCILDANAVVATNSPVHPAVFFELNEAVRARGKQMYALLRKHEGVRTTPRERRKGRDESDADRTATKVAEDAWRADKKLIVKDVVSRLNDVEKSWEDTRIDEWLIFCVAQAEPRSLRIACQAFDELSRDVESKLAIALQPVLRYPILPDTSHITAYSDAPTDADEVRNLSSQTCFGSFNFFRDSESFYRRLLGTTSATTGVTMGTARERGGTGHLVPCTLAGFSCIKWAGLHIKDDRELVLNGMRALLEAGWSLWDCSDRLRGDLDVCRQAFKDNYRARGFFASGLQDDEAFCAELSQYLPPSIP